ncbi:MAG: O-methyltransferase [Flavobacteriales bacterium]
MNFLSEEIGNYTATHTTDEPALLAELSRETWQKVMNPRMLSGHVQGRFLSMISKILRPKRILEIGTYTGYSALCLAEGLPDDGELHTIDINDELQWIQDKYFVQSPHGKKIVRHFDDALSLIPTLPAEFDLVFLDADKENYLNYYNLLMQKLKPGAVLLIDNVLWSGKVLHQPDASDNETRTLRELNDIVQHDQRVENVMLPLRDGMMMVRVK